MENVFKKEKIGECFSTVVAYIENEKGEFLVQKCFNEKEFIYSSIEMDVNSIQKIRAEINKKTGANIKEDDVELIATEKEPHRFVDVYHVNVRSNECFNMNIEEAMWMSKEKVLKIIDENKFSKNHACLFLKYIDIQEKNDRPDVKIKTEECNFKFRVRGIIEKNNKILCVCMQNSDFFCLPGGHVEVGELTRETIIREMKEETKIEVKIDNLVLISEDVYIRRDKLVHELAYYYKVSPLNLNNENNDFIIYEKDKDGIKKLDFKWFSKEEFKEVNFKPEYLKNKILNNDYSFEHLQNK